MSNQLQTNLDLILEEKNTKLLPENLKSGVTVLGITGTLEQSDGIDTSDATATADDIIYGTSAYVKGEKVEGTVLAVTEGHTAGFTYKRMYDADNQNAIAVISVHPDDVTFAIRKNANVIVYAPYDAIASVAGLTADKIAIGNTILGIDGTANVEDGVGLVTDLANLPSEANEGDIRIHVNTDITEFYGIYRFSEGWHKIELTNALTGDEYTNALAVTEDILDGPDEEPGNEPEEPIICFEFYNGPIKQLIIPQRYAPGGGQITADDTNAAKAQITMDEDFNGRFTVYNVDYGYTPVLSDDVGTTASGISVTGGTHTETDIQYYYWSPMDGIYVEFSTESYLMYDQILAFVDSVRVTLPENNENTDDGQLERKIVEQKTVDGIDITVYAEKNIVPEGTVTFSVNCTNNTDTDKRVEKVSITNISAGDDYVFDYEVVLAGYDDYNMTYVEPRFIDIVSGSTYGLNYIAHVNYDDVTSVTTYTRLYVPTTVTINVLDHDNYDREMSLDASAISYKYYLPSDDEMAEPVESEVQYANANEEFVIDAYMLLDVKISMDGTPIGIGNIHITKRTDNVIELYYSNGEFLSQFTPIITDTDTGELIDGAIATLKYDTGDVTCPNNTMTLVKRLNPDDGDVFVTCECSAEGYVSWRTSTNMNRLFITYDQQLTRDVVDNHLDDEAEYLTTFSSVTSSDVKELDNSINVASINVNDNKDDISAVLTDLVTDIQSGEHFELHLIQSNGDEKNSVIAIQIYDMQKSIRISDPTSVNSAGDAYNSIWFCINHPAAMMTMKNWIRIDANGDFVNVNDVIQDIDFSSIFSTIDHVVVYMSERLKTTDNIKAALQVIETIFGTTLEMGGNG